MGFLFGSYARGTAGILSDIDIGIAFPKSIPYEEQETKKENIRSELEKIYGIDKVDIENIPFIKNPLLRYIVTLGESQKIFCDDHSMFSKIADYARIEYEDTKPLRNIQKQALSKLFT